MIGNGASDPTTVAWQTALSDEGVAYTEVDATVGLGGLMLPTSLPALSSQGTNNFDAVVIADDPNDFVAGQLTPLEKLGGGLRYSPGRRLRVSQLPRSALATSPLSRWMERPHN